MQALKVLVCRLSLAALAMGLGPAVWAQSIKIGVFDSQRVSEDTALGKQVLADLASLQERKQAEIEGKQSSIEGLRKQLSQQGLSLSVDRRTSMEKDIQRQLLELELSKELALRELQLERNAAQAAFEEKLMAAVGTFGKDEGFTLVLDRSLVAFAANTIDVTSSVIDRFNQLFPVTKE